MKPSKLIRFLIIAVLVTANARAEEEAQTSASPTVEYVELKPAFIANYQSEKLRFVKVDITLMVSNARTAEAIAQHDPAIRHSIVMLLSRQDEASINTPEGKKRLREEALGEIIKVLKSEGSPADIQDILFTSFIVE